MSRRVLHGVEVGVSPEAAWEAFSRVEEWPRWFPTMTAVERARSGPFQVGEQLGLHLGFRGRGAKISVTVTHVTPGRMVRWGGRSFGVAGDHAFLVEPLDTPGRARFVSDETFSGFPVRLIPRFLFDEVERETIAGLERFKALVEST